VNGQHGKGDGLARYVAMLIGLVVGLNALAEVLPRLLGPLAVLTCLGLVIRIVWHITNRY
jgi:hypothetical protein